MKKIASSLFCIIVVIFTLSFIYKGFGEFSFAHLWKALYHSDFYINYEGGFVRRGLDGEIIFQLAKWLNCNPIPIQKLYNLSFAVAFIGFCIYFFWKYKPVYFVYFSMSVMLLYIYYLDRGFRKDHIILVFFIIAILFALKKNLSEITKIIAVNCVLIVGILLHEILFMISFFPLLIIFTFNEKINLKSIIQKSLYLLPSGIVFLIISYFFSGTPAQETAILNSWKPFGLNDLFFNSGIFNKSLFFTDLKLTNKQIIVFLMMILMHFLFVGIAISNALLSTKIRYSFIALLILQYVVILVLSFVAIDFSRWIFMGNFTSIITIYILNNRFKNVLEVNKPSKLIQKLQFLTYILYFVITMPHSGWTGIDGIIKHNPVHLLKKIYTNNP